MTISGFDLLAEDPGATVLRFFGEASGIVPSADIYVVTRRTSAPPERGPQPRPLGPRPPAWTVDLEVPRDAPRPLRFLAVVPQVGCPPDLACADPPGAEAVREELESVGPVGRVRSEEVLAP